MRGANKFCKVWSKYFLSFLFTSFSLEFNILGGLQL